MRARRELVGEPRLVEPRRADRPALVLDARRHDRAPAADPAGADVDDLAGDRHLVVAPELRDRDLVDRALVAARAMQQQVANGDDPERAQVLPERGADAGQRRDAELVEPLGGLEAPRPRPLVSGPHLRNPRAFGSRLPPGPSIGPGPDGVTASSSNQKKPTVPGPACVPTTAPSVVAISICACGRSCSTSSRSAASRSGAAACAIPTFRFGESVDVETNCSRNSANALWLPRTFLSGTTSPSRIARIGFTFSRLPASAAARPMRPPFARYSSVLTVKSSLCSCR